ncbi:hypothetical protein ACOSP7_026662 [Xanthoceras sorbifolium]
MILNLPSSGSDRFDSLCWCHDKEGNYLVRSGYRVVCLQQINPSSSSFSGLQEWWKFCWKLNIPTKVKMFLWRASNGWIPTMEVSHGRKVSATLFCPLCRCNRESVLQAVWGPTNCLLFEKGLCRLPEYHLEIIAHSWILFLLVLINFRLKRLRS